MTLDHAAAGVEVADNVAHVLLGNDDNNLHDRLHDDRISLAHSLLECHGTGDLKGHFRGVNFVIRTIVQRDLHVNNVVASKYAGQHGALDTLVNSRDILLRNGTADNCVDELVALARVRWAQYGS